MTVFFRTFVICSLAANTVTLVACNQSGEAPESGVVRLEYLELSGQELIFKLVNGSKDAVGFVGSSGLMGAEPSSGVTAMECWAPETAVSDEEPFALADGPPQYVVSVPPGDQVRLLVPNAFALRYKGGHCRFKLKTQDGPVIESAEFRP